MRRRGSVALLGSDGEDGPTGPTVPTGPAGPQRGTYTLVVGSRRDGATRASRTRVRVR